MNGQRLLLHNTLSRRGFSTPETQAGILADYGLIVPAERDLDALGAERLAKLHMDVVGNLPDFPADPTLDVCVGCGEMPIWRGPYLTEAGRLRIGITCRCGGDTGIKMGRTWDCGRLFAQQRTILHRLWQRHQETEQECRWRWPELYKYGDRINTIAG